MHNYKTEFVSNYVHIHTECIITLFERTYTYISLRNVYCKSTFILIGILMYAFQYIYIYKIHPVYRF